MIEFSNQPTPSLDRFGRRTKPRWNRPLPSGNVTLLNLHYGYDRDSYLTSSDDKVMDGLERLIGGLMNNPKSALFPEECIPCFNS